MNKDLKHMIEQELKSGYKLEVMANGYTGVRDPNGNWVVESSSSRPLTLRAKHNDRHSRNRTLSILRAAGALRPQATKSTRPRSRTTTERLIPKVQAEEILRDPNATGRERGLAKEYIRLHDEEARTRQFLRMALERLAKYEAEK